MVIAIGVTAGTASSASDKPGLYVVYIGESTLNIWLHSRFFVRVGHRTTCADIGNHHFFTMQSTLDLRNPIFPLLNRELFDVRKIFVLILKTGDPKKSLGVGEFAS